MNLSCKYCGCNADNFLKTGLFGCGNCYSIFLNPKEATLFSHSIEFEKSKIYNKNENLLSFFLNFFIKKKISLRFRIARNFKKQFYLNKFDSQIYTIIDKFLDDPTIKNFSKQGNLYFFDEDHLRAEIFLKDSKCESNQFPSIFYNHSIFDYNSEFGYLTACPTNSGRANKVSVMIQYSKIKETFREKFFDVYKENILYTVHSENIIIFLKNYNKIKLYNFMYNLYKIIKLNTYI